MMNPNDPHNRTVVANIQERIKSLAKSVYEDMLHSGLWEKGMGKVPEILLLDRIANQLEPERTQLLSQLYYMTFKVSTSRTIRIMWSNRQYVCTTEAQALSLPVATMIIQQVHQMNRQYTMQIAQNPNFEGEGPVMMYWDSFLDSDGNVLPEGSESVVLSTDVYKKLINYWRATIDPNRLTRRVGGVDPASLLEINEGAGTQYAEVSGSVIPKGGLTPPPPKPSQVDALLDPTAKTQSPRTDTPVPVAPASEAPSAQQTPPPPPPKP